MKPRDTFVPAIKVIRNNIRLFGSLWLGVMIATMAIYMLIAIMRNYIMAKTISLFGLQLAIILSAMLSVVLIPAMHRTAQAKGQWYVYRLGVMLTGIGATLCMTSLNSIQLFIGIILSVGVGPAALITAPWKELEAKVPAKLQEPVFGLFILAFPIGSMIAASVVGFCSTFLTWQVSFLVTIGLAYFINELTRAEQAKISKYQDIIDNIIRILFISSIGISLLYSLVLFLSKFGSKIDINTQMLTNIMSGLLVALYLSVLLFVLLFCFTLFFGYKRSSFNYVKQALAVLQQKWFIPRLAIFSLVAFVASGFMFIIFYFVQFAWQTNFVKAFFMITPYFLSFSVGITLMMVIDTPITRRRNTIISVATALTGFSMVGLSMHGNSYWLLFFSLVIAGMGMGGSYNELAKLIYTALDDPGLAISVQQRVNGAVNAVAVALVGFIVTTLSVLLFQSYSGQQVQNKRQAMVTLRLSSYDDALQYTESMPQSQQQELFKYLSEASAKAASIAVFGLVAILLVVLYNATFSAAFQQKIVASGTIGFGRKGKTSKTSN